MEGFFYIGVAWCLSITHVQIFMDTSPNIIPLDKWRLLRGIMQKI
jgi:hypothetical protein